MNRRVLAVDQNIVTRLVFITVPQMRAALVDEDVAFEILGGIVDVNRTTWVRVPRPSVAARAIDIRECRQKTVIREGVFIRRIETQCNSAKPTRPNTRWPCPRKRSVSPLILKRLAESRRFSNCPHCTQSSRPGDQDIASIHGDEVVGVLGGVLWDVFSIKRFVRPGGRKRGSSVPYLHVKKICVPHAPSAASNR